MGKFFKEGVIIILLTIVIIILLIIALYDYAPNNKSISEVASYKKTQATTDVLTEISTSELGNNKNESVITSYTITPSDLSAYASTNIYDQGRGNPFDKVEVADTTSSEGTNNPASSGTSAGGTQDSSGTNNNTSNTENTNTSTGYFNTTGKNK